MTLDRIFRRDRQLTLTQRAIRILTDGTQGWWYDPSDFSTLFQDAAGTTPVTAVEQPVGLMLDKSLGLVLGPELVTNGDGSSAVGWSVGSGEAPSASGGNLVLTATAGSSFPNIYQNIPVVVGRSYRITVTGTAGTSGHSPGVNFSTGFSPSVNTAITSGAAVSYVLTATASTATLTLMAVSASATAGTTLFDNISVREIPGNHATQATSTSRTILRNLYNRFTKTEQFDDVAWAKAGSTTSPTANTINFPNTAEAISQAVVTTATVGTTAHFSVELSGSGTIYIGCYRTAGGTYEETKLKIALTSTPTRYSVSHTIANAGQTGFGGYISRGTDGTATTVTADKASLVHNADAHLPYQRVNTATDYDSDPSKFPLYLDADGSDDGMATPAFAAGSDKVTVFAAVHKRSDAAAGEVYGFSATPASNNGAFALTFPATAGATAQFTSKGTSAGDAQASGISAPTTRVLTGIGDISADRSILRVNGVQVASSAADQGTGNFGTYPLYLFRRAGTSLPFNGRFYGGAGKFRTLSDSEIATVEQYLRMKSRAY